MQYGLIAEALDMLVVHDEAGEIQGVRYDELAPMMLHRMPLQAAAMRQQPSEILQQAAAIDGQDFTIGRQTHHVQARDPHDGAASGAIQNKRENFAQRYRLRERSIFNDGI